MEVNTLNDIEAGDKNPILSVKITKANGMQLDMIGNYVGLNRKRVFKFFRESDKSYKRRIADALRARWNQLRSYDVKIEEGDYT